MKSTFTKSVFLLLVSFICFSYSYADITLPDIISDGMVLQQNQDIKVWGWAEPNEEIIITTSWNNKTYTTKGSNLASFSVVIRTPKAGGPYTINLKGFNQIVIKDVMIGEVWLCSGQSNMEYTPNWGLVNKTVEAQKVDNTKIRFFKVQKSAANTPQLKLNGSWVVANPESFLQHSAVAYYFANQLQEDLKDVPIGLVISAWGGSPAEPWIPASEFEKDSLLQKEAQNRQPNEYCPVESAQIYNTMINPINDYKIAGTIWYQGESNVGSKTYDKTLKRLIKSWRSIRNEKFPFYYVQIAPYGSLEEDAKSAAILRDSQRKLLDKLDNIGMVVIGDVSTNKDIHPPNKKPVGQRLGKLALVNHYKTRNEEVNGPLFEKGIQENKKLILSFRHSEGLYLKNNKSTLFEVAGEDKIYYTAKAKLKGENIILCSKYVKKPLYVRYAWRDGAIPDLFNASGLPASNFTNEK